MIRALIVDDEFLARKKIMTLLEGHNDVHVIGECRNGAEAIEMIKLKEPDLVFLDIQMPDIDGFGVLSRLEGNKIPHVIFATAFDTYAIKAFEAHALDYLLKPFDEERFNQSLSKAKSHLKLKKDANLSQQLLSIIKTHQALETNFINSLQIKEKGVEITIFLDDVFALEAEGNYISLLTEDRKHLYRSTMNSLEEGLNPEHFLRIHRSFILNKRYIQKCVYTNNNEYKFHMKNSKVFISGRAYKENIIPYIKENS